MLELPGPLSCLLQRMTWLHPRGLFPWSTMGQLHLRKTSPGWSQRTAAFRKADDDKHMLRSMQWEETTPNAPLSAAGSKACTLFEAEVEADPGTSVGVFPVTSVRVGWG